MYDFYLTIPYGLLLIVGGIIGYVKKGSIASLGGGVGFGLLLLVAGFYSLRAFGMGHNSYHVLILETVCAAILTLVMGQRYIKTNKMMPAGAVAGISILMTGFYIYMLATGGNHIPSKMNDGSKFS